MQLPTQWQQIADDILKNNDKLIKVIVIGGVDTGKSTFVKFLVKIFYKYNKRSVVIDTDLGQSNIGPPTTIGMGIFNEELIEIKKLHFIGATSPAQCILPVVLYTYKLIKEAEKLYEEKKINNIIIDTNGLIEGVVGATLKYYKIETILPDYIIALQNNNELEHILSIIEMNISYPMKIYRVGASSNSFLRRKSQEERRENRKKLFLDYFKDAKKHIVSLKEIKIGHVNPINKIDFISSPDIEIVLEKNILLGLKDEKNELVALGIVDQIDLINNNIVVISPIEEINKIKALILSNFKLNFI